MSGKIYFTKQRNVDPWRARKNSHLFSWDSVVILSVKSYFVNSHVKLTNPAQHSLHIIQRGSRTHISFFFLASCFNKPKRNTMEC